MKKSLKSKMLKIAGVASDKEFYKKFPTEEAFMAAHGGEFKKAMLGSKIEKAQWGTISPAMFNQMNIGTDILVDQQMQAIQDRLKFVPGTFDSGELPQVEHQDLVGKYKFQPGIQQYFPGLYDAEIASEDNTRPIPKVASKGFPTISPTIPEKVETPTESNVPKFDFAQMINPGIKLAKGLIAGLEQRKQEKEELARAKQWEKISGLMAKAASMKPEEIKRKYVRPEDIAMTGEEQFPVYGVGTNVLAKDGKVVKNRIGGTPSEIMNIYNPGDIYSNLGYESIPKAGDGFNQALGILSGSGDFKNLLNSAALKYSGGESAGATLGATFGEGVSDVVGVIPGVGPIAKQAIDIVAKPLFTAIGNVIDTNPEKIKKARSAMNRNIASMIGGQVGGSLQSQFSSHVKDGGEVSPYGWVSHTWTPQVITHFGEHRLKDLLASDPTMDTLRTGGNIRQNSYYPTDMEKGGELQTLWGGHAEPVSYNPYLPSGGETVMFKGNSHEESDGRGRTGIGVRYGEPTGFSNFAEQGDITRANVEVETGEPAMKMPDATGDENLVVFGNLKIPNQFIDMLGDKDAKGKKFKNYANELSALENKQNKLIEKSTEQLTSLDVKSPIDKLTFNSLNLTIQGANEKLKSYADKKIKLSSLQDAINSTAEEQFLVADDLAKGKVKFDKKAFNEKYAEFGSIIPKLQAGGDFDMIARGQGRLDVLSEGRRPDIFKGKNYKEKWIPLVETAFSDAATAEKIIQALENYGGQDADDVKALLKGKTLEQKKAIAKRLATDNQVGPYHIAMRDIIDDMVFSQPIIEVPEYDAPVEDYQVSPDLEYMPPSAPKYVKKESDWKNIVGALASQLAPYLRPSDVEELDPRQLAGEMYAMATNQLEPVEAQLFQPDLRVPYDISLQDILNENTAAARAAQRTVGYNPAAQANIAAQQYAANQKVLGEQFRMNQAMKDQVYSENRKILDDAELKNLAVLDQQYQRQAEAKAKTKATTQAALSSISNKYLQNQLENRTLATYENMYNYRFDPRFRAVNWNAPVQWNMSGSNSSQSLAGLPEDWQVLYDNAGNAVKAEKKPKEKSSESTGRNGRLVKAIKGL